MTTEKRMIDANVVLAKQFAAGLSDASGNYYGYADVVFADDIENAPTTDAVEVVLCKDCVHYDGEGCLLTYGEFEPNSMDFCSYGEMRNDG